MKLSNKAYDVLKRIALVVLPAIATFYSTLAIIWGFPYVEQVVGTIGAVEVLIGGLLEISTSKYNKEKTE